MAGEWWRGFYTMDTAALYLERDAAQLRATIGFLVHHLRLRPGDHVFDQGCGIGAVSIALARTGMRTTGVDLCAEYIDRAQQDAEGLECRFVHGDAFEFEVEGCDAAINWYTSFGYAESDEDNARMLHRVHGSLRPGGRFALDYSNVAGILADFRPTMVRERDGVRIERQGWLDLARGRVEQDWHYHFADGRHEVRHSSVKLYLPHRLRGMMEDCGFADVALFGDVDGRALAVDSPRCILTATRP